MKKFTIAIALLTTAFMLLGQDVGASTLLSTEHTYFIEWTGNTDKYPGPVTVDQNGLVYATPRSLGASYWLKLDNQLNFISQVSNSYSGGMWGLSALTNGDILGAYAPLHGYNYPPTIAGPHQAILLSSAYGIKDSFGGNYGSDSSTLHNPTGISSDASRNVYIADTSNNRIIKLDSNLSYVGEVAFNDPNAIDVRGNHVYASSYDGTLLVLNLDLSDTGLGKSNAFSFGVQDIAVDSRGQVWAGVLSGIQLLSSDFSSTVTFSSSSLGISGNIGGIAFDKTDHLFVTHGGGLIEFSVSQVPEAGNAVLFIIGLPLVAAFGRLRARRA